MQPKPQWEKPSTKHGKKKRAEKEGLRGAIQQCLGSSLLQSPTKLGKLVQGLAQNSDDILQYIDPK